MLMTLKKIVHLKLLICIASALLFASCKLMLVPPHNAAIEQQIIATEKMHNSLYINLLQKPKQERLYDSCVTHYVRIESEINSILFQNMARPMNENMIEIIKKLKKKFAEYRDYHKENGILNDGEIKIYEADVMGFWQPLLVAERALKNQK